MIRVGLEACDDVSHVRIVANDFERAMRRVPELRMLCSEVFGDGLQGVVGDEQPGGVDHRALFADLADDLVGEGRAAPGLVDPASDGRDQVADQIEVVTQHG